jgi:hypothetical protein
MNPKFITMALLMVSLLACNPAAADTPLVVPQTQTTVKTAIAAATPMPPPPTPSPTPGPFDDVSIYYPAMRPEFQGDVDAVAQAGATRYAIDATFWPNASGGNPRLTGTEQIRYTNTETVPLAEIYFRLYPNLPGYGGLMEVEALTVNGQPAPSILKAENTALRVALPAPLPPGQTIDMTLTYSVTIPAHPTEGYNVFSYTENTAALAGFYPAIAVFDGGLWHTEVAPNYGDATYLDVSLYEVRLTVPQAMVIAASGSEVDHVAHADGAKTVTMVSGPMRDFYVALNPDYRWVSRVVDGVVVSSYYPPALEPGGEAALQYASDALQLFEEKFGPYPYAEFDVAATPTTAGGVEYPGIVVAANHVYNETEGFLQHVIAHETAHQWWYGLVGNNQITEPWLDEALTNYSAAIYREATEGPVIGEQVVQDYFYRPYQQAKNHGADRSVIGPVTDFSPMDYGAIVYGKGPLFFLALRTRLGDELYFKVMRTYAARYKYNNATADDLLSTIEEVSGQSVQPLVKTWLQNP